MNQIQHFFGVKHIDIDETSYCKGHKYLTIITDHDKNLLILDTNATRKEVINIFIFFYQKLSFKRKNQSLIVFKYIIEYS